MGTWKRLTIKSSILVQNLIALSRETGSLGTSLLISWRSCSDIIGERKCLSTLRGWPAWVRTPIHFTFVYRGEKITSCQSRSSLLTAWSELKCEWMFAILVPRENWIIGRDWVDRQATLIPILLQFSRRRRKDSVSIFWCNRFIRSSISESSSSFFPDDDDGLTTRRTDLTGWHDAKNKERMFLWSDPPSIDKADSFLHVLVTFHRFIFLRFWAWFGVSWSEKGSLWINLNVSNSSDLMMRSRAAGCW